MTSETAVLKPGDPAEMCPDAARLHTPSPQGYTAWHNWAEEMGKTHRQRHCPTCGRLAIWVPKARPRNMGAPEPRRST